MNKQEYKIVKQSTNSEWFFFAHSFKTARQHAEEFLKRNGKKGYTLYRVNEQIGDRWIKETI